MFQPMNLRTSLNIKTRKLKSRMWDMKTKTIPMVIGALGVIKKGVNEYLEKIPGSSVIGQMQKIALLGTNIFCEKCFP